MATSNFEIDFQRDCVPQLNEEFGVPAVVVRGTLRSGEITIRRSNPTEVVLAGDLGINGRVTMREVIVPKVGYGFEPGRDVPPQPGDVLKTEGEQWELFSPDETSPIPQPIAGKDEWRVWAFYRKRDKVAR